MLKKQKAPLYYSLPAIIFSILFSAAIIYAWTGPSGPPPTNNADTPLNVSGIGQYKTGALRTGGLTVDSTTWLATQSGNVGIGTAGPSGKLEVVGGSVRITQDSEFQLLLRRGVSSDQIWFGIDTFGNFRIKGNSDADKFTIQQSGNVGIGTTGPTQKLEVAGGSVKVGNSLINSGTIQLSGYPTSISFGNGQFVQDNGGGNMRIYGGADMQLDTSTGHIKLMPAGNVGIGMVPVSGKYKLDVAGAIHATSDICTDSGGGKCLSDPPPPLDCSACGTGHSCWDSYTAGNSNYEHCGSICTPAGWRQLAPCGSYY